MKQRALLFSLAAGAACLALRLLQNHIGFEADTRLPVPGSFPALLLPLLLLLSAAALIFLTRRLPRSTEAPFSAQFGGADAKCLTLTVLGCFLVGLSGVWELLRAVSGGQAVLSADGLSMVASADSGHLRRHHGRTVHSCRCRSVLRFIGLPEGDGQSAAAAGRSGLTANSAGLWFTGWTPLTRCWHTTTRSCWG